MTRTVDGCQRCGISDYSLFSGQIELVGAYHTRLCMDCHNAFECFMREHAVFIALDNTKTAIQMLYARSCGDGIARTDEIIILENKSRSLMTELHEISHAWVTSGVAQQEQDDGPGT